MRVLNERGKALEVILSNKIYIDKKETALLLVKYYNELGEDVLKIRNNILDFLSKNEKDFNKVANSTWVERFVKNNLNVRFNEKEYISISKSELEKISSVKNLNIEKLLFVMLVCAKYDKQEKYNDYWYNEKVVNIGQQMYSELFKMAKIKQKKEVQYNILNTIITTTDMLSMSNRPDRVGFKLNYVDNSDEELKVYSFEEDFINEYLKWRGYDLCEECGETIEKTTNKKYCNSCVKQKQLQYQRDSMKKLRNVK